MLQAEIFVGKRTTVDAVHTGAIALIEKSKQLRAFPRLEAILHTYINKITALNHEILDHSMEKRAFVAQWHAVLAMFASTQLSKILAGLWYDIGEELEYHSADFLKKNTQK